MAPQQKQQLPTRSSGRTPKPSARKRAQSVPTPSIVRPSKKIKRKPNTTRKGQKVVPLPSPSPPQLSPSPPSAQIIESTSEDEDNRMEELVGVEDEDIDKLSPPPPARFTSIWRAVAGNRNESLPGIKSAMFNTNNLYFFELEQWKEQIFLDLSPRKFKVSHLQAVASYEKARQVDCCPHEVRSHEDLRHAIDIINHWHKRWPSKPLSLNFTLYLIEEKASGAQAPAPVATQSQPSSERSGGSRRTATQAQLTALPDILAAEVASGNHIPAIAYRWPCRNPQCRNNGETCWQNKKSPDAPDVAINHFPVSADVFLRWSREILSGLSTRDQPSQNIIVSLVSWKERNRKNPKGQVVVKEDSTSSNINNLVAIILASQIKQMNQYPQPPPYYLPPYSNVAPLQNSSHVRSETDPIELLGQFFDWLVNEPGFNSERQRKILKPIKIKLMEEQWSIESLKSQKLGEGMTSEIWDSYDFRIGSLCRIRSKISDFKRVRL